MSDVDGQDCLEISERCPVEASIYGYYPSRPANYFFAIIFGICLIVQVAQYIKWKSRTYAIALIFGCLGELVGTAGRPTYLPSSLLTAFQAMWEEYYCIATHSMK